MFFWRWVRLIRMRDELPDGGTISVSSGFAQMGGLLGGDENCERWFLIGPDDTKSGSPLCT